MPVLSLPRPGGPLLLQPDSGQVVPRIVAISLTVGFIRGLIALELFRKSPTFTSPKAMRLFAACMSFFAAITVNCGIMTVLQARRPIRSAAEQFRWQRDPAAWR